jgi:organic hydroperoxide reductase OsmC/OhrA
MDGERNVDLSLELESGYRFRVDFNQSGVAPMTMDEPPPLGDAAGPNAARMLAAAVGHCLSASALYCLNKARVPVSGMTTRARATLVRNEQGRLRVGGLQVELHPRVAAADRERLGRCLDLFEDYCVVTQSVKNGVEVTIEVRPEEVATGEPSAA